MPIESPGLTIVLWLALTTLVSCMAVILGVTAARVALQQVRDD
jgi:hypothetical protein